jgi:hypothetical protein
MREELGILAVFLGQFSWKTSIFEGKDRYHYDAP